MTIEFIGQIFVSVVVGGFVGVLAGLVIGAPFMFIAWLVTRR